MSATSNAIVVGGREFQVPGLEVVRCAPGTDAPCAAPGRLTNRRNGINGISAVILHTTRGSSGGVVQQGSLPSTRAEWYARYQVSGDREVSWDFTVDTDGTVVQSNDPAAKYTWHAGRSNGWSVGIEIVQQQGSADLWSAQLTAVVRLVTALCDAIGIPKITPVNADGTPYSGLVAAWNGDQGGEARAFNGVAGHRNVTRNRGSGDPTNYPFQALLANGFRGVPPDQMTRAPGQPPARVATPPPVAVGASSAPSRSNAGAIFLGFAALAAGVIVYARRRRARSAT